MKKFLGGLVLGILLCFLFWKLGGISGETVTIEKRVEVIKEVPGPVEIKTVVEYREKIVVKKQIVEKNVCLAAVNNESQAPRAEILLPQPDLKNRVSLLLGVGPTKLEKKEINSSQVEVENQTGLVFGLSYERKLENFNLGIGGMSNKTIFTSIGKDF